MAVDVEDEIVIGKVAGKKAIQLDDGVLNISGPSKMPGSSLYPVPSPEHFGSFDFVESPALVVLAESIIDKSTNLAHLKGMEIRLFWKKKGGAGSGQNTLGKCMKPSGLNHLLADCDFIIWLAADHLEGRTRHEVESTLFHELCHAGRDEDGNRTLIGHDVQEFRVVLERYGATTANLRAFVKTARQLSFSEAE